MDQVFNSPISWKVMSLNDILLLRPNLIFDFEVWLFLAMFIQIILLSPLHLFKAKYKLNSKISTNHNTIFGFKIYGFV
jgi:hypothetical protein